MKYLKINNIADNTLVVFLGDNGSDSPLGGNNGIASSAPIRGKKGSKWEGGTRVPFIAAWSEINPGNPWQKKLPIKPGIVQERFGTCYDIFPTIAELLDINIPEQHIMDGISLNKLLTQHSDPDRKDVFLAHYPHSRNDHYFTSYRDGKWKLIYHYFPALNGRNYLYELHNLESDPTESNDLARRKKDVVKLLMKKMIVDLNAKNALYPVDSMGIEVRPEYHSIE